MNVAFKLFVTKNKIMGTLLPTQTAKSAKKLFFTPRKYPLKTWEEALEKTGERLQLKGGLSAIRWGESKRKILLVHGWESRATQMSGFADKLVKAGFQVIALDAPAHGKSSGRQANLVMFARAIAQASAELGPFDTVIGHSLGGTASTIALSEGMTCDKLVLISSPSSIENVLQRFCRFIGLPLRVEQQFIDLVSEQVGRSPQSLEVAKLIQSVRAKGLIIHDKSDVEVPYSDAKSIEKNWNGAILMSTQGYGHRLILRKEDVWLAILSFVHNAAPSTNEKIPEQVETCS